MFCRTYDKLRTNPICLTVALFWLRYVEVVTVRRVLPQHLCCRSSQALDPNSSNKTGPFHWAQNWMPLWAISSISRSPEVESTGWKSMFERLKKKQLNYAQALHSFESRHPKRTTGSRSSWVARCQKAKPMGDHSSLCYHVSINCNEYKRLISLPMGNHDVLPNFLL